MILPIQQSQTVVAEAGEGLQRGCTSLGRGGDLPEGQGEAAHGGKPQRLDGNAK